MTASRKFGVFAIVFAVVYPIVYIIATEVNLAAVHLPFRARPSSALGPNKPTQRAGDVLVRLDRPPRRSLRASIAAIATYLPDDLTRRMPAALAWVVPLAGDGDGGWAHDKMYFMR